MMSTSELDGMLLEILEEPYETQSNLFPPEINSLESIREKYHCFRSFQRASDTRAIEEGVDPRDINVVNRWRQIENAKGRKPNLDMHQHYAEFQFLMKPFMRYTKMM